MKDHSHPQSGLPAKSGFVQIQSPYSNKLCINFTYFTLNSTEIYTIIHVFSETVNWSYVVSARPTTKANNFIGAINCAKNAKTFPRLCSQKESTVANRVVCCVFFAAGRMGLVPTIHVEVRCDELTFAHSPPTNRRAFPL